MLSNNPLREGLHRAWDVLNEGWNYLRDKASGALTYFSKEQSDDLITRNDQLAQRSSRWSLLAAEVTERDRDIIVKLEVPGMEASDLDVEIADDCLVVSGEKRVDRDEQVGRYHVTERAYGRFRRVVALPAPVDDSQAKADYRRGVLKVTLPKTKGASRQRINVSSV